MYNYFISRYLNIYTSNGVSLHELAVSLSKDKKFTGRQNDKLCRICSDTGDLILCDVCPRAYHKGIYCNGFNNIFMACHELENVT